MPDRNRQSIPWSMEGERHPGEVSGDLYSGKRLLMHSEEYFHFSYCCEKDGTKGLCQGNTELLNPSSLRGKCAWIVPKKQWQAFQGASHSSLHVDGVRHHHKMELLRKRWRQLFHCRQKLCSWGTHCSKGVLHSSSWSESRNRRSWDAIFYNQLLCCLNI